MIDLDELSKLCKAAKSVLASAHETSLGRSVDSRTTWALDEFRDRVGPDVVLQLLEVWSESEMNASSHEKICRAAVVENSALRQKVAELEADARRYQWLKENGNTYYDAVHARYRDDRLDAAIDAQIADEKGVEG
jgi:hypothetical protein